MVAEIQRKTNRPKGKGGREGEEGVVPVETTKTPCKGNKYPGSVLEA